jgi:hypothetical protein
MGAKRPGREADQSVLSHAKVKNAWVFSATSSKRLYKIGLRHKDKFVILYILPLYRIFLLV